MLKNKRTYEIMDASTIGLNQSKLVLGKHSGRHAFRARLQELGYELSPDELNRAFARFKELADKKKVVDDRDIEALVAGEVQRPVAIWTLDHVQVSSGTGIVPTATVRMKGPNGELRTELAHGTGPIDAVCQAVNKIVGEPGELVEFAVGAITEGVDAVAEVTMRVQEYGTKAGDGEGGKNGRRPRVFSGYGVNTDTVIAAAEAYVGALNKLFAARIERQRTRAEQGTPIEAMDWFGNSVIGRQ
jgi:2-isopropylmalate synthase